MFAYLPMDKRVLVKLILWKDLIMIEELTQELSVLFNLISIEFNGFHVK